jgi:hypothetical protein
VLTLPKPGEPYKLRTTQYGYGSRASTTPLSAWQFHLDENLDRIPSYLEDPPNNLFIEWVYVIDLDRETVRIRSGGNETSFGLISIPPNLQWAKDFVDEEEADDVDNSDEEWGEGEDEEDGVGSGDDDGNDEQGEAEEEVEDHDTEADDEDEDDNDESGDIDSEKPEGDDGVQGQLNRGIYGRPQDDQDHAVSENPSSFHIGQPFPLLVKPDSPPSSILDAYMTFRMTRVVPKTLNRPSSQSEHVFVIRETLFSRLIQAWSPQLTKHIFLSRPDAFIFREFVFAFVSLACGDFKLLADQSAIPSNRTEEETARLASPCGASVVPDFGSGAHFKDVLPGSAPQSAVYWFKGVLIMIADGMSEEDGLRAATGQIIKVGQKAGKETFDAVVTNIRSFALVRVRHPDIVQHTAAIDLVVDSDLHRPRKQSPFDLVPYEAYVSVVASLGGFNILMNFFEVAATYMLKPFKASKSALPNELYDSIISLLDPDTYLACADVSYDFRHAVNQHIRLSQLRSLSPEPRENTEFTHHVVKGVSSTTSQLVIFDSADGRDVEGTVQPCEDRYDGPRWAAVIGQGSRASMLTTCTITCSALAALNLPLAEIPDSGLQDPEYASVLETAQYGAPNYVFGEEHYYLPKYAGCKDSTNSWENYLRNKLALSSKVEERMVWRANPEGHAFLLPPSTGCIPLTSFRRYNPRNDPAWEDYDALGGMVWVKKPADLELVGTERVVAEAEEYLQDLVETPGSKRPLHGGLLVVAFGTKVLCIDWDVSGELPTKKLTLTPLQGGDILDIGINDQRERFEELFGKFRDATEAKRAATDEERATADAERAKASEEIQDEDDADSLD